MLQLIDFNAMSTSFEIHIQDTFFVWGGVLPPLQRIQSVYSKFGRQGGKLIDLSRL